MHLLLALVVGSVLTLEIGQVSGDGHCAKIATFNPGLLTHVPQSDIRRSMLPGGLTQTDSDVYCLQEVWLENDIDNLLNNDDIKKKYPYHYSPIYAGLNRLRTLPRNILWHRIISRFMVQSACSYWDRFYFTVFVGSCIITQGCMQEYEKSGVHGTHCLAERCGDVLWSPVLKTGCIQCLFTFMKTINEGGEECMPNPNIRRNRLNPAGLMLLSKKPLSNVDYTNIYQEEDLMMARGYIEADVEGIGKVVCTHLSYNFPLYMEHNTDYDNYNQMQQYEINHLIQTFQNQDIVLAGDFNTGPAINATGADPEWPDNHQRFLDAGYTNPYAALPGECSYCKANPISTGLPNALIDHVLIKGTSLTASSPRRIMDDRTDPPYSDHYGVEVNVCSTGT